MVLYIYTYTHNVYIYTLCIYVYMCFMYICIHVVHVWIWYIILWHDIWRPLATCVKPSFLGTGLGLTEEALKASVLAEMPGGPAALIPSGRRLMGNWVTWVAVDIAIWLSVKWVSQLSQLSQLLIIWYVQQKLRKTYGSWYIWFQNPFHLFVNSPVRYVLPCPIGQWPGPLQWMSGNWPPLGCGTQLGQRLIPGSRCSGPPARWVHGKNAKPVPAERVNLFEKRSKIMKMHFDIIVSTIPWIMKDWAQPWIYCHCPQIHNHCVHDVAMTWKEQCRLTTSASCDGGCEPTQCLLGILRDCTVQPGFPGCDRAWLQRNWR